MNKVAGIGIAVVVIAVVIVAAMSFSNDSFTTNNEDATDTQQIGPFTVESDQEISQTETIEGTDFSVVLTEKIGIKTP